MCDNYTETHAVIEKSIKIKDISQAVLDMPSPRGFIMGDAEQGIKPRYAKSIAALYLLMHWPLISEEDAKIDDTTGTSATGVSMYAAILEHGKTYVADIFFADEKTQSYRGSHKSFSIDFPENTYVEDYDDWLMDDLASRVLGVKQERSLGHNIVT
ncbi:MAG: hypothetical protein HON90_01660 [Halobacteriovoraceae bacterium]|jgi:hypothetical protein|nr:hypothetical protein [Halobacteriovoraceae bacterium]